MNGNVVDKYDSVLQQNSAAPNEKFGAALCV